MSMVKISHFLKVNDSLDGVRPEQDRWFSINGLEGRGKSKSLFLSGILNGGRTDPRDRYAVYASLRR